MLQLLVRTSSNGNSFQAIQVNRDTTICGLKKYLESVFLIPYEKQILQKKGKFIPEQYNESKCIDMGFTDDSIIDIEGPTLLTQDIYDIEDFRIQFSGNDPSISLMPRCTIIWKQDECPEHSTTDYCHICQGTYKIRVPMYCPFTPVINRNALNHDFIVTFDIQGKLEYEYDITKRRNNYELIVIPSDRKHIRVILNDFSNGLSFITCKMANEIEPKKTQFKYILENNINNIFCKICMNPIFNSENINAPMVWAWACEGCNCKIHPKCAIDYFKSVGNVKCGCVACWEDGDDVPFTRMNQGESNF